MPKSRGNLQSKNRSKSEKPYVKREQKLRPVVHDEPTGPDLINNLNNDCLGRVFQCLSFADKLRIERVCRRWRDLSTLAWEDVTTFSFRESNDEDSVYCQLPCEFRTNEGVGKLLKKCGPYLKKLNLSYRCDWRIMRIVSEYYQNLKDLRLDFDCFNWETTMSFPRLEKVSLEYNVKRNRSFPRKALQALPSENLIEIRLCGFSRADIQGTLPRVAATVFKNCTKLSTLSLTGFDLESDVVVAAITEKPTLTSLTIRFCFLKEGLSRLTLLTKLENLDISGMEQVNDDFLNALSDTCRNLKTLDLTGCYITDKGIINFWKLSKLEELVIAGIEDVTDAPLGNLKSLKKLDCWCCRNVNDHGIIQLILHARNLEHLDLGGTPVTEKILEMANEIAKERINNLLLGILVDRRMREVWMKKEISPLLILKEQEARSITLCGPRGAVIIYDSEDD